MTKGKCLEAVLTSENALSKISATCVVINFQVWMVTTKQLEAINKLKQEYATRAISAEKLEKIEAGRVDLTLIPKGAGRQEILINNLYTEIKPQEDINIKTDLQNTDTLDLFNIILEISPQLSWTAEVKPKSIAKLTKGDKKTITINLRPGSDLGDRRI